MREQTLDAITAVIACAETVMPAGQIREAVDYAVTKQPAALYQDWAFTKEDYFRDPQALPDLHALQANVDLAQKLGFLRANLDVGKYADLSIAEDAAKRTAEANH